MSQNSRLANYTSEVLKKVSSLAGHRVMIVGDIGLDEYVFGAVRRISPEAPVPVVEVEREELRLGLGANVAQNVASLGGEPVLIATVGQDDAAVRLRELLTSAKVSPQSLLVDRERPTIRKMRVMVQNHHIVRVDYEMRKFLSAAMEGQILAAVSRDIKSCSAVIIQDYAKGMISEKVAQEIIRIAHNHGKKVLADPHRSTPTSFYRGVDLMTPNYDEAVALSRLSVDDLRPDSGSVDRLGQAILAQIGSPTLVITRGKEGMSVFEHGKVMELPTFARQVADVAGAGDTVIAAIALAWGAGFSLELSCAMANMAAGVVVAKVGCVPCSVDELVGYAKSMGGS